MLFGYYVKLEEKKMFLMLQLLFLFFVADGNGHVLNYDSVTLCDGIAKQIQCPGNENIHVLQGFYGKWRNHDCKGESPDPDNTPTCSVDRHKSTGIARNTCQGRNTCTLFSHKSIFGEPCPNNKAYLYVTFFCLAPGHKLKHQKTPDNQEVVSVPSHGFVVQETRHNIEEVHMNTKEERKKTLTPPANPRPLIDSIDTQNTPTQIQANEKSDTREELSEKPSNVGGDEAAMDNKVNYRKNKSEENENANLIPSSIQKQLIESAASQKSRLPTNEGVRSEETSVGKQDENGIRSSTICNGQSKLIACLPEEGIQVHYAFYGKKSGRDCKGALPYKDEAPTCSALDARSNVQSSCNGKQTCLLFADDNIYGKSLCPNVNKYLYLKYSCTPLESNVPSAPKQLQLTPQEDLEEDAVSRSSQPVVEKQNISLKVCNGEKKTISCKKDVGMNIVSAFYGKSNGQDCRGSLGYRDDIPDCSNPRVLESIKFLCENRRSCELASENELFGDDVCPGINKYLQVTYAC